MKKRNIALVAIAVIAIVGYLAHYHNNRIREVVILSTNDMHASISNFPRLATAVAQCRDTVATILVDAGDRWTGNAYVDWAEGRRPILDLMNSLGYDVAALGNHEFDLGAAFLEETIHYSHFATICANVESSRSDFATPAKCHSITTPDGVTLCFAGVVTNYDNGHPDGNNAHFEGLHFPDPMEAAREAVKGCRDADVKVLLSHMAYDKDMTFAAEGSPYEVIIGGHSHTVADTTVNNVVIGQTGRKLKLVGATRIRLRGNQIESIEYENIDLANYAPDAQFEAMIEQIENNPELKTIVGSTASAFNFAGLANLESTLVAKASGAEIGFFHYGGIRLAELAKGEVQWVELCNLEPFFSTIYTIEMTPAQMRKMIIDKYNDTKNTKESHRIDLFCSVPYNLIVDSADCAHDVRFPTLREGRRYRVALTDYVAKKYDSIEGLNGKFTEISILEALKQHFLNNSPVKPDNRPRQRIVRE